MLKHIHFGAGAFGLGFVCWLTNLAKFDTTVFNRAERKLGEGNIERIINANNKYVVQVDEDSGQQQTIELANAIALRSDQSNDQWISIAEDPELNLITTSIKNLDGLESYHQILLDIVKFRAEKSITRPIYFFACENGFNSYDVRTWLFKKYPDFKEEIEKVFVFVPCVVDRICSIDLNSSELLIVQTEEYARIFVQAVVDRGENQRDLSVVGKLLDPNVSKSITDISKSRLFNVFDFVSDIEKFKKMKSLIVNGSHFIIALRAHRHRYIHIDDFVVKNSEWCRHVLEEMAVIASHDVANDTLDQIFYNRCNEFAEETLARFSGRRDLTSRVLSRFVDPYLDVVDQIFLSETSPQITFIDNTSVFFKSFLMKVLHPAQEFSNSFERVPVKCFDASVDVALLLSEARYPSLSLIRGQEFYTEFQALVSKHGFELASFVKAEGC